MNTIYRLVGRTILLSNYRGDGRTRLLRVMNIRSTYEREERISGATQSKSVMVRGPFLITATDLDRNVIRSYYINHADVKEVGFFGRLYHKLTVWCGKREIGYDPVLDNA